MVPVESPITKKKAKQSTELDGPWTVVVFDDPVNLMEYVAKVFQKVFGYSRAKAEDLMMTVHKAGKALVWTGSRERAELYVQQLQQYQLQASLEKSK
jgi:ATP-dependent Clp protease adaptor protein ClpS